MLLSDLIKALIDIAVDRGDAKVYVGTEDGTEMYNTVLLHYLPLEEPVLRIEAIADPDKYEKGDREDEEE